MENRRLSILNAQPPGRPSRPSRISTVFIKNPWVEVMSIGMFMVSVFAFVALITYQVADPSFFSNLRGPAQNACGKVGAIFASLFLQFFGLGSFVVPAAFFFLSVSIYKREGQTRLVGTLGGMTIAVMALTVFLTLQWRDWAYGGGVLLMGGTFGAWVAEGLMKNFNSFGASWVSFSVFCLAIAVSTPLSVARVGAVILRAVGILSLRIFQMVGTYLLYLSGLLLMRMSRATGNALKRGIVWVSERWGQSGRGEIVTQAGSDLKQSECLDEREETKQPQLIIEAIAPSDAPNVLNQAAESKKAVSRITEIQMPAILPPEKTNFVDPTLGPLGAAAQAELDGHGNIDGAIAHRVAQKFAKIKGRLKAGTWKLPEVNQLKSVPKVESNIDREKIKANAQLLTQKLQDFGIDGEITAVRPGPVITLYEFKPAAGVKVSRIASLVNDLSMALSAQSVRIVAPIPGKSVVGIEIPSDHREMVYMKEFLQHPDFFSDKYALPVVMGKDIGGATYLSDLAKMPHLLCAGQTGSGKSVFMNGLICSLLFRYTPDELRLILIDPKFIEFSAYQHIPHLLLPVVDDPKNAATALRWAVQEMERRYRILAKVGVRNLASFNQKVEELGPEKIEELLSFQEDQSDEVSSEWTAAFELDAEGLPRVAKLPYVVVIIDELADLMMLAKKDVEVSIARIAQKARAAGIHLVIATQRPSTDIITGLIKANLPSRVSFRLASHIDSRTILDHQGAERLLGQGDMLFIPPGAPHSIRLHGAYLSDDEIHRITSFLKGQGKPIYRDEILQAADDEGEGNDGDTREDPDDELFQEAIELVKHSGHASASYLQRHLKVGYNRAARMIETMESRGVVGPAEGARPRQVLIR